MSLCKGLEFISEQWADFITINELRSAEIQTLCTRIGYMNEFNFAITYIY